MALIFTVNLAGNPVKDTEQAARNGELYVQGDVSLTVEHGRNIGDVVSVVMTCQFGQLISNRPAKVVYGQKVSITATDSGSGGRTVWAGFITEVNAEQVNRRTAKEARWTITASDYGTYLGDRQYPYDGNEFDPIYQQLLDPSAYSYAHRANKLIDTFTPDKAGNKLVETDYDMYRNDTTVQAIYKAMDDNMPFFNSAGELKNSFRETDYGTKYYYYSYKYSLEYVNALWLDRQTTYSVREILESFSATFFARCRWTDTGIAPMLAKPYAGEVFRISPRYITRNSTATSRIDDFWNTLVLTIESAEYQSRVKRGPYEKTWLWGLGPDDPFEARWNLDLSKYVATEAPTPKEDPDFDFSNVANSYARALTYSRRIRYASPSLKLRFDHFYRKHPSKGRALLRTLFNPLRSDVVIPTIETFDTGALARITAESNDSGLIHGVVEKATLTIHPRKNGEHPIELDMQLMPGEFQDGSKADTNTEMTWEEAPDLPFYQVQDTFNTI